MFLFFFPRSDMMAVYIHRCLANYSECVIPFEEFKIHDYEGRDFANELFEYYRVYLTIFYERRLAKAEKKRAELDRAISEKEVQLDRLRKESARIEEDLRATGLSECRMLG